MPKKNVKKKKSSGSPFLILFIVALVTVLYLARQVQEKDKQILHLKSGKAGEKLVEKKPETPATAAKKVVFTKVQEDAVKQEIKNNLDSIIGKKPQMSGKWFSSSIKFNDNDTITLLYEDGHEAGEIVFKIQNPADFKTWQVVSKTK